jgi:hypothetical protein
MKRTLIALTAALGLAASFSASALVVTMDSASTASCPASPAVTVDIGQGFEVVGSSLICPGSFGGAPFTTNFLVDNNGSFTLQRINGGAFTLNGFDVAMFSTPGTVAYSGGGTASPPLAVGLGITSVTSGNVADLGEVFGVVFTSTETALYDNFDVTLVATASEPGTVAVLGLGLMALGFRQRRKNRA